jgi:hypothetical protein
MKYLIVLLFITIGSQSYASSDTEETPPGTISVTDLSRQSLDQTNTAMKAQQEAESVNASNPKDKVDVNAHDHTK